MEGKSQHRYSRNQGSLTQAEQNMLAAASVLVLGCGGLGGYVIEELARIGVGSLTVWDGDKFEESNLNRQLLALSTNLGSEKALAAVQRVQEVNPLICVQAVNSFFTGSTADREIIARHQVVVDALDTISSRLTLARCCQEAGVTMIHGAVGGWWSQIAVIKPGDRTLEMVYQDATVDRGCEQHLGNLVMTVAATASLQAAETVKVLLGRPHLQSGQLLLLDLLNLEMQTVELSPFLDTLGNGQ